LFFAAACIIQRRRVGTDGFHIIYDMIVYGHDHAKVDGPPGGWQWKNGGK
jgi:hypothetical protein